MWVHGEGSGFQATGTPLNKLNSGMQYALSFILEPAEMSKLCALAKCVRAAAWSAAAWTDTVVDTRGRRPLGIRAHSHWTLWHKAKHVLSGSWAIMNVRGRPNND